MKKRVLSALLTLVMLFTLIPATAVTAFAEESAELFANTCAVTFTTPSDVVLTVSEGFAVGMNEKINDGKTMKVVTPVSQSTEGDVTSHLYNLPEGTYRFLAMGEDSVGGKPADGAKVVKYYNWDKNFIVTAADVAAGSKTIDADPGLLANTGWEQKRTEYSYFVRQFTDEVLASEAATVSDATKAKYPEAFSTPSFTATNKARHEFTTQSEMEAFVAQLDEKTDYMTTYFLGRSKGDKHDLRASFFTAEDLTGKTLEQAAETIKANGKPTILIHAQMHGDEQSGTEGALATMAYLCGEYGEEVIKTVNIVSIPRVNPDGSEIYKYESGSGSSWRNVNRDAMELTQPETKILVALYNLIEPEVCLDHHEYRASTESTESHIDDVRLSEKVSTNAPKVLADIQYELVDYLFDAYEDDGLRGYYYRSSPGTGPVTMRAYYTLRGSICMLAEIPGQRKGNQMWDRRVFSQFLTAKKMIDWTVENADLVNETVAAAKAELAATGKTFDADNQFTLQHANGTPIAAQRHIFDLRDGTLIEVRPYTLYRGDAAAHSRAYPIYYVVPKDASGIAKVLSIADMHGIEYSEVGPDEVMELRRYGGDYKVATLGEPQLYSFAGGAYKFPVAQELNAVLCTLMEPDNLDAQEDGNAYKSSFSLQGHLKNNEIYRCENDSKHALTFVPAKGATCDTVGNLDHYLCTCGKAFAANEHVDALAEEDYIIPVSGHDYVEQTDGSFVCSFGCGESKDTFYAAIADCDGIGGRVKLSGSKTLTEALIIPANVTVELGAPLYVNAAITVNDGGAIMGSTLAILDGVTVNLGENGGYVPVYMGGNSGRTYYDLCHAETKTGKDVTYFENGTKYAFGYKFADHAYYAKSASAAAAGKIKLGVNVSLQAGGIDADYSFSVDSADKMKEVGTAADDFFKVNLSLTGAMVDDVVATPYIKVSELGFRTEGAPSTDFVPVTEVAAFGGEKFTSLEAAVAAAEAAGGVQDIDLLADITYKRPTTLKMNGNVRFVAKSTSDITISGPLTIDGQNKDGGKLLFQIQDEAKLTLNGVTIQNYRYTNASSNYGAVGRVEDSSTLVMKNCTVKNC
ncbi:MAG: hypothetical protein IIX99_02085, partial [Oscillospiraceae bacterium]|nr:hypothetical protein [Oscillospiraceae bacterium]